MIKSCPIGLQDTHDLWKVLGIRREERAIPKRVLADVKAFGGEPINPGSHIVSNMCCHLRVRVVITKRPKSTSSIGIDVDDHSGNLTVLIWRLNGVEAKTCSFGDPTLRAVDKFIEADGNPKLRLTKQPFKEAVNVLL